MKYNSYPSACEVFSYGEVENYAITITGGSTANLVANPDSDFILESFEELKTGEAKDDDTSAPKLTENIGETAIPEAMNDENVVLIKVYPNPATNLIKVDLSSDMEETQARLQLYNAQGRLLQEFIETIEDEKLVKELNVSDFPNGFYILKIAIGAQIYTERFVVSK